ncbi:MAG: hypothetical protein ACK523_17610, partial [Pirellulaceae bacterium]
MGEMVFLAVGRDGGTQQDVRSGLGSGVFAVESTGRSSAIGHGPLAPSASRSTYDRLTHPTVGREFGHHRPASGSTYDRLTHPTVDREFGHHRPASGSTYDRLT